jgi:hypothetical protein
MTTLTRPHKRPTYIQVLEIVRRLSPAEQRRLRDELAKLAGGEPVEATVDGPAAASRAPLEAGLCPEVLASLERSLQENAAIWDELSKL